MKPFLALEASAGSGKTFALSVRFIALILNGANINEIVALTFTRKAANEMKERVVETFLNLKEKPSELEEISKILNQSKEEILGLRDARLAKFLEGNLKITTFDSFFVMILRQFSLNMGLSSDFKIVSGLENLQRAEFALEISKDKALLKALANLIISAQNSKNSFFDALEMFYDNFGEIKCVQNSKFPSEVAVENSLRNLYEYALKKDASDQALKSFEPKKPIRLLESAFVERDSLNYRTYSKIYSPELDELFWELKANLKLYFDELEAYKLSELNKFLQIYKSVKLALNRRLNSLTFSDVSRLTYELLCKNFDAQVLYFRLDGRINHLLIDEFQDTNVTQYEIMLPLISEILSGYGQNGLGSFFYVGDIKQSIYRFRGGKKELFAKLQDDFKQIKSSSLDTNYRSFAALVKFTNAIFKDKISDFKEQLASTKKDDRILDLRVDSWCEYFVPDSDDYGFLRVVSNDDIVSEVLNQVKFLLENGVKDDDITVLCWKNEDINFISSALESAGINLVSESTSSLLQSPYVRAIVEYAKFCLFKDPIYKLNVEALLDTKIYLLDINPSKPAFLSLNYLAQKLNIDISNIDILRLFELAREFKNLADFIFNLDSFDAVISAKNSVGVKIMTVHKSKGLQFENVIVCDRIGGSKSDSSSFLAEYDVKDGWKIKQNIKKESFDEDFKNLKNRAKELEKEENLNKLYVAFTRAICGLVVIKKSSPDGRNPSFFTAYELKSSQEIVEYLDLKEFTFGQVIPSKKDEIQQVRNSKDIDIIKVARQDIDTKKDSMAKNQNAIYLGLAFHYLFEMTARFDERALWVARSAMFNKFHKFLSDDELEELFLRGLNLIKDEKFIELTTNKKIYKEQPLKFNGSLKQIDLMCIDDNEICIIDYKTSDHSIDENISQITNYRDAISKFYPNLKIKAVLFYTLKNKIQYIEI
ncbi:RecB-like helicase [Campylobacter sp. RM16187]|uniref:RecB-like helicase n=1 Tax=Campylobacter sp. RM16187 TaxID=1660063 RepID=UPI0021B5E8E7|nr:RecB-like helicase [Campylobacter sp. RM16187]QKG30053.1 exonuclease V, helicase AddA [Campylobacter sp. RM16187]